MRIAKAGSDNVDLGKDGCNRWCQNTGIAKKGGGRVLTLPRFQLI